MGQVHTALPFHYLQNFDVLSTISWPVEDWVNQRLRLTFYIDTDGTVDGLGQLVVVRLAGVHSVQVFSLQVFQGEHVLNSPVGDPFVGVIHKSDIIQPPCDPRLRPAWNNHFIEETRSCSNTKLGIMKVGCRFSAEIANGTYLRSLNR